MNSDTLSRLLAHSPGVAKGRPPRGGVATRAAAPSEPLKPGPASGHAPFPEVTSEESDSSGSTEPDTSESEEEGPQDTDKPTRSGGVAVSEKTPPPPQEGGKEDMRPGWSGSEITFFRLLHPTFRHNYCAIAELLGSKSCREVFEQAQAVGPVVVSRGERRRFLRGKRKKKNMR